MEKNWKCLEEEKFETEGISVGWKEVLRGVGRVMRERGVTVKEFFEGKVFGQRVKTKKKEGIVDLIDANDFFGVLEEMEVKDTCLGLTDEIKQEVQSLLCLDRHYMNLLMLIKIDKALKTIGETHGTTYQEDCQIWLTTTPKISEEPSITSLDEIQFEIKSENPKKVLILTNLCKESKNFLLKVGLFLKLQNMTTGDFFKDSKYEKLVKSPTKTVKVWLIPVDSFFNLIEEHMEEISSSFPTDTVKQELQDLLCLDSRYPDLLMMKKINKAFIKVLEENGICYKEGFQNEPTQEFSEQKPTPPVQEITKTVEEIKPRKKINNLSDLSDCARNLLLNLSIFLDSEGITVTEFLNEFTYEQLVKSSKREATVDIISTDDFFRLIEENDKITSEKSLTEEIRQELQDLLWLDMSFNQLLNVKKITKYVDDVRPTKV